MMNFVLIRFDAPLMSFGGVVVDQYNKTEQFPNRSMLTGLIANALGWSRHEEQKHTRLQERLQYAARQDLSGGSIIDYQTVDFDDNGSMALKMGWTTRGVLETREGGTANKGTHIRYRHYLTGTIITVAIGLERPDESPTIDDINAAFQYPARPLFIGRKCCIPSTRMLLGTMAADSPLKAICLVPRDKRSKEDQLLAIWTGSNENMKEKTQIIRFEDKDWANSIHIGRTHCFEGLINPPGIS